MSGSAPRVGAIGRLGRWTAGHFRIVAAAWVVIAVGLGVLAPHVETALSGAGWETTGSESVQARQLIDKGFKGLGTYGLTVVVHAPHETVSDPAFAHVLREVQDELKSDPAVATVVAPRPGVSISPDRHVAVIQAGGREVVQVAIALAGPGDAGGPEVGLGRGPRSDLVLRDDVGEREASTRAQDAGRLREDSRLVG